LRRRRDQRGIGKSQTGEPWSTFYIEADDLQAVLDRAESMGAKTAMPVTDFGGMVTIAMFTDPDGLLVGLVKPVGPAQSQDQPGPLAGSGEPVDWFEVLGSDAEHTQRFYADLFGWTVDTTGFPGHGGPRSMPAWPTWNRHWPRPSRLAGPGRTGPWLSTTACRPALSAIRRGTCSASITAPLTETANLSWPWPSPSGPRPGVWRAIRTRGRRRFSSRRTAGQQVTRPVSPAWLSARCPRVHSSSESAGYQLALRAAWVRAWRTQPAHMVPLAGAARVTASSSSRDRRAAVAIPCA
jgi:predicted enzyme related to lactoylglutathione lyase